MISRRLKYLIAIIVIAITLGTIIIVVIIQSPPPPLVNIGRYVRCVRGVSDYGINNFVDNGNGTITDLATGLMWMQNDSGTTMNWSAALSYAENLNYAGFTDWRLPNAKELQSIVDYSHAPDAKNLTLQGPAINTIYFNLTETESWFWTSTTHIENQWGIYICFGLASAYNSAANDFSVNAHGAGAQRSDPKSGDPNDYPQGFGPQADEIRINNYARAVRNTSMGLGTYVVVDTGQISFHGDSGLITEPIAGQKYYGQDANYQGFQLSYQDNGDGTITDLNTGLIWQKTPPSEHLNWTEAKLYAENLELAGYSDWRVPTIKELYSLIAFYGDINTLKPYIDINYFDFEYPDTTQGYRVIDAQYWSSNMYVGTTMDGQDSSFGVNFADGRIKSYPI